jgi:hypothetical protein
VKKQMKKILACSIFCWLCLFQAETKACLIPLHNPVVYVGQSVELTLESPKTATIYANPAYDTFLGSGRTCINGFQIGKITNSTKFTWVIPTNLPIGFYRISVYDETDQENQCFDNIDLSVQIPEPIVTLKAIPGNSVAIKLSGGFEREDYSLETSTDLMRWSETLHSFTTGIREITNNATLDKIFFRAKLKNALEISYSTLPENPTNGQAVCFIGHTQGGNGSYEYVWTSSDCLTSESNIFCEGYSPGDVLTLTVTSGQQRKTVRVYWPQ